MLSTTYSRSELKQIQAFLDLTRRENHKGFIKLVYRGDKLLNLFDRMNVLFDPSDPDWPKILELLFMLGEKSRHNFSDGFDGRLSNFTVEDVSDDFFTTIFKHMAASLKSNRKHHQAFFKKNPVFIYFFSDKSNRARFIDMLNRLGEKEKFGMKRYYLTALHQLGVTGYKPNSIMLSSSESRQVAMQFAKDSKTAPSYIIHAWALNMVSTQEIFKRTGLPKYHHPPFKKQKEISFFAGILPHYIISLEDLETGRQFYNPAILLSNISPITLFNGFNIDQTSFKDIARHTRLRGYFVTDGDDTIQESI